MEFGLYWLEFEKNACFKRVMKRKKPGLVDKTEPGALKIPTNGFIKF
jgi:hypothetical protein